MNSEQFLSDKFKTLKNEFELASLKSYDSEQLKNEKKKQLTNAAKSIGDGVNQNLVVGILDSTMFGSGKEGALFTGKRAFIRGTFGTMQGKIDLSRLKKIDFSIDEHTNDKGKEFKEYYLKWSYSDEDKDHELSTDSKTDGGLLACIEKILSDFDNNESVQETDHGITLSDLGDDAVFQYLKIIYLYLNSGDSFNDRDMRNYVMLQSQLHISDELDEQMRVYRLESKKEDILVQVEQLKVLIPEGSQSTILQSLINDILSTLNDEDLSNWQNNQKLLDLIHVAGITDKQVMFYARTQQLNRRQLKEKLTDNEVKELTKKLAATGASAGASMAALAVTGASIGAFGELGLGTLALATMSTGGIGLAVLGIGAASVAAYKGVEHLTDSSKTKYAYRNELLQDKVIKLSNSQQIIMKDINYITNRVAEEMDKNEDNELKIQKAEMWIASIKKRSTIGTKMNNEKIAVDREQIISELPQQLNLEKLHELVSSHTFGNEIENQILESYDGDKLRNDLSVRDLSVLLNRLNSVEYTKTVTVANAKVTGKKVKNMANSFIKRHMSDEGEK